MVLDQEKQTIPPSSKETFDNIKIFRDRFDIPVSDDEIENLPYVIKEDSPEIKYLKRQEKNLEGSKKKRHSETLKLKIKILKVLHEGSGRKSINHNKLCSNHE